MITNLSQLDKNKTYSYADYLTWQFDEMVELIKGKLFVMSPAPAERHQRIIGNLHGVIWNFFRHHTCSAYIAPFDVRLLKNKSSENEITTVVQPDICVICDLNKIDQQGCLGAPDLIIEIISPSTAKKDINDKFILYEENGVKEYWIVFPDSNALDQYHLVNDKYQRKDLFVKGQTFSSTAFPDLRINLEEIF